MEKQSGFAMYNSDVIRERESSGVITEGFWFVKTHSEVEIK